MKILFKCASSYYGKSMEREVDYPFPPRKGEKVSFPVEGVVNNLDMLVFTVSEAEHVIKKDGFTIIHLTEEAEVSRAMFEAAGFEVAKNRASEITNAMKDH